MSTSKKPETALPSHRSPEFVNEDVAGNGGHAARGAPAPTEGELLGERFALHRPIGQGGAGTVFPSLDTKLGQRVAVKVLRGDIRETSQLDRFRREVRAARPGHPNAVAVYDLFDDGQRRFLTMELMEGRSLGSELTQGCRLPVEETVRPGRQIAAALVDLHAKGRVHRDVKPGKFLVTDDGTANLCDMGLARSTMRGMTITETAIVVG